MLKASSALIPVFLLAAFGAIHQRQQSSNQQTAAQQQATQQQATQQQQTQQNAENNSAKPPATPRLEFEVAVIKPSAPNEQAGGIKADPGGQTYHAQGVPVQLMIQLMWKLHPSQIVGGPDWLNKDLWDVNAKADTSHNLDDLHTMYQNMIIDRFKMKFHWDERDMPMYALVQDKGGEKMKLNPDPEPFNFPIQGTAFGKFEGKHCDMRYFTWFMSGLPWVGKPVVDQTGLDKSTSYDFTLAFDLGSELPPEVAARGNLPPAPGPEFFTAIREQLGLRLEPTKGSVPVMVIDHIEKASEADN